MKKIHIFELFLLGLIKTEKKISGGTFFAAHGIFFYQVRIQIRNLAAEALANPRSEDLTNAVSWVG